MRQFSLLCCLLPLAAATNDHWIRFSSGPFEVYSSVGPKDGRETLVRFEEFRHALGQVLGDNDLGTPLPVRILLFKSGAPETPEPVIRGRDQHNLVLTLGRPIAPEMFVRLTQLFLEANTARMPQRIEHGLEQLFSTIEVTGIHITLGRPPAHPDLDWARLHLLTVDPQYHGNLRVLTYNLRKGVDEGAAFRNAFSKTPEQIELEAKKHLESGQFQTTSISPLPMSPQDFPERSVEPAAAQLAIADLLLGDSSRMAYRDLISQKARVPEAYEGLGLLALRAKQADEARKDFSDSMAAGSKSAGSYVEFARLETDNTKALAALEQAVKLNPKLAEPHFLMASRETDPPKRIEQLKQAAKLDARNLGYWQALAEAYLAANDFPQAAQAWRSAEQAAASPADRARMQRARLEIEQQRLDWEASERQRKTDAEARELERLKEEARAEVRALETRANHGAPVTADGKVVAWWDGPKPSGVATGILKQVDCLGKRFRVVVESDQHKLIKLLVPDPSQIAVVGGGESTLGCGAQQNRHVKIEYFPKANARLATTGEVATIEFQ